MSVLTISCCGGAARAVSQHKVDLAAHPGGTSLPKTLLLRPPVPLATKSRPSGLPCALPCALCMPGAALEPVDTRMVRSG